MRSFFCILFCAFLSACSHTEALRVAESDSLDESGDSYHDIRLLKIIEQQNRVIELIEAEYASGQYDEATLRYKMQDVTRQYQSFLSDNPGSVEALICYGKLLRRCGERKEAHFSFMRANVMDPDLAVVKQQMGNFYAEERKYDLALVMYMEACRLEPEEAVYYYGLGELLQVFRDDFIQTGSISESEIDEEILNAFKMASDLAKENVDFAFRYGEAFYDLSTPRWRESLAVWEALLNRVDSQIHVESVYLHLARVYAELGEVEASKAFLDQVDLPVLAYSKKEVLEMLSERYPSELEL